MKCITKFQYLIPIPKWNWNLNWYPQPCIHIHFLDYSAVHVLFCMVGRNRLCRTPVLLVYLSFEPTPPSPYLLTLVFIQSISQNAPYICIFITKASNISSVQRSCCATHPYVSDHLCLTSKESIRNRTVGARPDAKDTPDGLMDGMIPKYTPHLITLLWKA